MPFEASYAFSVPNGATLKWSLVYQGTLHATLRNQTTGIYQVGTSDLWEFDSAILPSGYRGLVILHTNTASALSDFNATNAKSALSVNPGEIERIEKAIPDEAPDGDGGILTTGSENLVISGEGDSFSATDR